MTHELFKELMEQSFRYNAEKVNEFLDGLFVDETLLLWFNLWRNGEQKQVFDKIDKDNTKFLQGRDLKNWKPKGADQPITRTNFNSKKAEHLFKLERENIKKIKDKQK